MATLEMSARVEPRLGAIVIRSLVVALNLATAAIHLSLGGLLFMTHAICYATLALAMIVPGPIGQVRWLVRLALIGFTTATIGGWLLFGARFPLAYLDKTIEVVLIAAVAFELWRSDGGPLAVVGRARRLAGRLAGSRLLRGIR